MNTYRFLTARIDRSRRLARTKIWAGSIYIWLIRAFGQKHHTWILFKLQILTFWPGPNLNPNIWCLNSNVGMSKFFIWTFVKFIWNYVYEWTWAQILFLMSKPSCSKFLRKIQEILDWNYTSILSEYPNSIV